METLVDGAVKEVFGTMLNLQMVATPADQATMNGQPQVAGAVGFVGRATGVFYIYTTVAFARRVTCGLLGLTEGEIHGEEMVNDAMGEIANMVVGYIKSRLVDRGMSCVMTIPSVVRGSHFDIEGVANTETLRLAFDCNGNPLRVEVLVKATE